MKVLIPTLPVSWSADEDDYENGLVEVETLYKLQNAIPVMYSAMILSQSTQVWGRRGSF